MYVPDSDESMLQDAPAPVVWSPYTPIVADMDEMQQLIAREIEELRAILSSPRRRPSRKRDD